MRRIIVVAAALGLLALWAGPALAQEAGFARLERELLVVYLMVSTVLVFIMHAGFAMLEAGFTRSKNAANIIGKNLLTICVGIVTYYAIGFGLMYGDIALGLFGTDMFFLSGSSYAPAATLEMDFAFQAMFAATAATIVSGAVAERMRFGAYLAVAAAMTALVYPLVGAWTWGGGWLDRLGYVDFAGSGIVHMTGGVAGLVGAAFLGARIGRYNGDNRRFRAIPGHSMPLAALGVLLLFFGWFGFNGGSVLAVDGATLSSVLVTTALAGCAGGLSSAIYTRLAGGAWDVPMTGNGMLAGLVGITAGADAVSNSAAIGVGAVAGVLVALSVALLDRVRVDDPVGAVSVHGTCGVLGVLWVGLFHASDGLFHGGGVALLAVQIVGVVGIAAWVGACTAVLFGVLKALGQLRVSEEEEFAGLDLHEHGMYGYPETAVGPAVYPGGALTEPHGAVLERPVRS